MDFFAGTVVEKNPTTYTDIDLPNRENKGKIKVHVGAYIRIQGFSTTLLMVSCWMCPWLSVPQCLHLHSWSLVISILLEQEVLGIFFPFGSATQAPKFKNFASGPVINTLVACNMWLSQGHAAIQWQRYNCARIPWGWSLTATPGHPSPPLLLRGRLGVGIAACTFTHSVPLHPVLPVLFDTPQFLLLLLWLSRFLARTVGSWTWGLTLPGLQGKETDQAASEHRPSRVAAAVRVPVLAWHWWHYRRWTWQFPEFNTCR